MKQIFVNLKRFEVSRELGGVCPAANPVAWIRQVVRDTVRLGLGQLEGVSVTYFLPEALIVPAVEALEEFQQPERSGLAIGSQSVFREDIRPGGNFGAFTTNRPAAAIKALGCTWTIIAHSEERRDKLQVMAAYDPAIQTDADRRDAALAAVDRMLNEQARRAAEAQLDIVFCIGESAEQKGSGDFAEYAPRVRQVLRRQLETGLAGLDAAVLSRIVIGYEPIWAIGPGKVPPDAEYITFVSSYIKQTVEELFGVKPAVIYGGGLKEENARSIASVGTVDGGLIALTRFTPPIGFDPESLRNIVLAYTT